MSRGKYLAAALEMGLDYKSAMLSEIADVNEMSRCRSEAYEEAKKHGKQR